MNIYLVALQIPETDAECRWDWRYARCEPHCDCHFLLKSGDFHLGRACRLRPSSTEEAPAQCDIPPSTRYAVIVKKATEQTREIALKARTTLGEWKRRVQEETCGDLPTTCGVNDDNHRTIKQKVLCRHVPLPCSEEDDLTEFVMSPLGAINATKVSVEADKTESTTKLTTDTIQAADENREPVEAGKDIGDSGTAKQRDEE